ncbi:MAG: ATP-binding cassette domain-containing protein [Desulfurococcaceae archaeon]
MNTDSSSVVELKGVWAGYKIVWRAMSIFKRYYVVLKNINLNVRSGERVAIIGESGSGKSTLLKVILGLLKPIRGEVRIHGVSIYQLPWKKRVQTIRKVGYVPQDQYKALNPSLEVKQILAEPLEVLKLDKKTIEQRIKEISKLVGLPSHVLDLTPDELSGGLRQRVLIARALIHEPTVLLLDEPTSALDVSIQAQIINLLNDVYLKLHPTMILVTHDLAVAQYLADRVLIIKDGIIVEEGPLDCVLRSPKSEYARSLVLSYYVTASLNRNELI